MAKQRQILKRGIQFVQEVEVYDISPALVFRFRRFGPDELWHIIECPGEVTVATLEAAVENRDTRKYFYMSKEDLDLLAEAFGGGTDAFFGVLQEYRSRDPLPLLSKMKPANLYWFKISDHTLWRFGEEFPISLPIFVDSCYGGVTTKYYHMDQAEESLYNSPLCSNISREEVPSYNQDIQGEEVLIFTVTFPQELYDEILTRKAVDNLANSGSSNSIRVRSEDFLQPWGCFYDEDVLGLNSFRRETPLEED